MSCHEGNIAGILVLEYVCTLVVVPAGWCVPCEDYNGVPCSSEARFTA